MNELWQAVLAQTTLDAVHWIRSGGSRCYTWKRRANPTRLEAFQAWRWCVDPKYADDREAVCDACGKNPNHWVKAFSDPDGKIHDLERWSKAVLRQ